MTMKKRLFFAGVFALLLSQNLTAQWSIQLNINEYYPLGNDLKTGFPALWYDSKDDRGLLFGGFGGGVSYRKTWLEGRRNWWFRLDVQRSRFYDVPVAFVDENGQALGAYIGVNTHLNATALAMPEFVFGKFSAAAGLGLRGVFWSKTDYGEWFVQGEKTSLKLRNRSLSPVAVVLPMVFKRRFGRRIGLALRSDFILTPASRVFKKERAVVVFGEVSYDF